MALRSIFLVVTMYICTHQGYLASLACVVSPVIVKLVPLADSPQHTGCVVSPVIVGLVPLADSPHHLLWMSWTGTTVKTRTVTVTWHGCEVCTT